MNFLNRLEYLSQEKNISNNHQLAELSGVPYTTIDNFYRKGYENVKLSTLKKLADFFGCSIDFLCGDEEPQKKEAPTTMGESLTKEDYALVRAYRGASNDDRTAVNCILRKYKEEGHKSNNDFSEEMERMLQFPTQINAKKGQPLRLPLVCFI